MKTFYHKTSGNPAVFYDDANIADWPEYSETAVTDSDLLAAEIRAERDALLDASDKYWTQATESASMSGAYLNRCQTCALFSQCNSGQTQTNNDCESTIEWHTYRQALRDLPEQTGFPTTVTWPTKPEVTP